MLVQKLQILFPIIRHYAVFTAPYVHTNMREHGPVHLWQRLDGQTLFPV